MADLVSNALWSAEGLARPNLKLNLPNLTDGVGMPKHMDARDGGQQLFQITQALRDEVGAEERVAGDIRFGCCVIPHQSISHRVCHSDADDGDDGCGLLRSFDGRGSSGYDYIDS